MKKNNFIPLSLLLTITIAMVAMLSFSQASARSAVDVNKGKKNAMKIIKASYCLGRNYDAFKKRTSQYDVSINKYSKKYGISVALIKSVITAESCFNSKAVSPKGAQGLMQLMPATAERFGVKDSFDPDANIRGGTRYLKFLLEYFEEDLLNAIAAYNSGEGTVRRYKGIPPYKETRKYVSKVSTLYKYYSNEDNEDVYKEFKKGDVAQTFFIPRAMPKSRLSPYKNQQRHVLRGKCKNRTSTRIRQSTKVLSGRGVWQRLYVAKKGDTLTRVMSKTGVHKIKLMQMNRIGSRARLREGQEILVWECRK